MSGSLSFLQEHILEVDESCRRNCERIEEWEVNEVSAKTQELTPVHEDDREADHDSGGVSGILHANYVPSLLRPHLSAVKVLYLLLATYRLVKVYHYFLDILDQPFLALSILRLHCRLPRNQNMKMTNSFKDGMKRN